MRWRSEIDPLAIEGPQKQQRSRFLRVGLNRVPLLGEGQLALLGVIEPPLLELFLHQSLLGRRMAHLRRRPQLAPRHPHVEQMKDHHAVLLEQEDHFGTCSLLMEWPACLKGQTFTGHVSAFSFADREQTHSSIVPKTLEAIK